MNTENNPGDLSLEQSFRLKQITDDVKRLSREQLEETTVEAFKQLAIKDNWIKQLIKRELGIE